MNKKPKIEIKDLPDELSDLIINYLNKKCCVCLKKMCRTNMIDFFEFPKNNINSKLYCSSICFNYI